MQSIVERLEQSLRVRPAVLADTSDRPARAAVAIAFRTDRGTPELLLIRRAVREGDPWSGQVALPGGRWQPGDADLVETARRETSEETGLDIAHSGRVVATLDELRPRSPLLPPIVVTPVLAVLESPPALTLNHEVAAAFWVPWTRLTDPATDQVREVRAQGATWRAPSFVLDEYIVWGMTERILRQLIERATKG